MSFEILFTLQLSYIAEVRSLGEDWLFVRQIPQEGLPNTVELRIYTKSGQLKRNIQLNNRALWWDTDSDILSLDAKGVHNLISDNTLFERESLLGMHAIAQPQRVDFVHEDLLLLPRAGSLDVLSKDGKLLQTISLLQISSLGSNRRKGGIELNFSSRMQSFVVEDWEGDGDVDILVLSAQSAALWLQTDGAFRYESALELPVNLYPVKSRSKKRTELDQVWFQDFNNDGALDLGWSLWTVNGSWLNASSKVVYTLQRDGAFGEKRSQSPKGAVFDSRWLDFDGDGDLDLISLEADLGWANLSRAFLTKKSTARLLWYPMQEGLQKPILLKELTANIEDPSALYYGFHDVNQDGWLDLFTNQSSRELKLYLSQSGSFPSVSAALDVGFIPKCIHSNKDNYCWNDKQGIFFRWLP